MASIDQRIVELKFNAKNFQTGIQAAIASLDNLKKNLNMNKAADEFDKVEKASKKVTFKDLYSSVDSISNRFSTLGIIGMSALNQITTTAMQTGKKLLSALVSPLIEGGKTRALNIEQAKFQIEGLGYTWDSVNEDISYGVKNTAYGLDAAAKACSQLLASQVKVGVEMRTSLRAISGVAAMTGSEYEDISNIFTTVAGNGRLMGDQLLQLSTRGLNAAATLGKYLGKSESEVREMVSKGQIDFQTFANAMDSAFGEHAKKANETFTGSLSNMKAALARIGAEIASPAYTHLRDIFNSLTPIFDGVKKALVADGGLFSTIKDGMSYVANFVTTTLDSLGGEDGVAAILTPVFEKLNRITKAFGSLILGIARTISSVVTPIFSAFGEVLGGTLIDIFAGAIEILAKFFNSLALTERMSGNLKKTFVGIFTVINVLIKLLAKVVAFISKTLFTAFSATFGFVADIVLAITGHIGDLIVKVKDFVKEIYNLSTVQSILSGIRDIFKKIKDILSKVYTSFRKLAGTVVDKAFESALWVFDKMSTAILIVANYIDKAIMKLKEFIGWLKSLPAVQNFINNLRNAFDTIRTSISGTSSDLKTKFIEAFNNAKEVIGKFVEKLKELISQYIELPTLQEVVTAVVEFMTTTFEKAVELFMKIKDVLSNLFDRVKELNEVSLRGIIDNFGKLKDKIIEVIDVSGKLRFLSNLFGGVKEGATQAAQGTVSTLDLIKQKFLEFVNWLKDKFSQITMKDVIAAGIGGSFIAFLVQLTKFVSTATKLTASLDKVVNVVDKIAGSITGAIDSFAKINKAKADAIKMEAISNLIKSVVLLAGAVALLASMDPEKVLISAGVLLVLAGGLIGLSAAMNAIASKTNPEQIAKSATQMIAASGSILILAVSLKLLSTIPVGQIISSLIAITFLMGEMLGFMVLIGKVAPQAEKEAFSMLMVAAAIIMLARAMGMIGAMSIQEILSSTVVMGVLILALGVMFKLAGEVAMTKEAAVGIIAIVASLLLIIRAMKALAKLDSRTITLGLTRMIAIMGVFSLLMIATRLAGKNASKAGVAILLISAAMILMSVAIKQMASIDNATLSQATKSINEMLKIFALITLVTKFAGDKAIEAGASIMIMAGAIVVIAGAMLLLSLLSDEDLKRSTIVITTILGMFTLLVAATGLTKACQKTLKQMTICLALLIASIAVLSLIEPRNLLSASAAISMLMGTFALVLAAAGVGKKAMSAVWQLVAVVGVLSGFLALLAQLDARNALMAATALSELMVVIGGMLIAMSVLKVDKVSVGAAAQLAAAIDVVIFIIGLLVAAVAGLNAVIPDLENFLASGIPILQKVGQAIGEFVGGIIGGVAAGASYGLVILAENLEEFIKALKPFMEEVKNIDDSVIEGAMKLVGMLLLFAAADFIAAVASFAGIATGGAIDTLMEKLPMLGKAMKDFAESLDGTNLAALAIGAEAARAISEVGLIFSEGGLKGLILGDSAEGLKSFGENLPLLGDGMKKYGDSVSDLNGDAVVNSVPPLKAMIEVVNLINGEGGFLQLLAGSTDIGTKALSANLPGLGKAITDYGESVKEINAEAINNSVAPLKSMIEVVNIINGEGGLLQLLGGSTDKAIKALNDNLPPLGEALTSYGDKVAELKADAINNSVEPLRSLVEISNMINGESGLLNVFGGSNEQAIKALTANLPPLGEALTNYSNKLEGMDAGRISDSVEPLRALVEISNMIDNEGGMQSWVNGSASDAINAFKENLPNLGTALKDYGTQVKFLKVEAVKSSAECLRSLIDVLNSTKEGITSIFGGGTGSIITSLTTNLPSLGTALKDYSDNVSELNPEKINASAEALSKIVQTVQNIGDVSESIGNLGDKLKEFSEKFRDFINNLNDLNYEAVDSAIDSLRKIREEMAHWAEGFPDITPAINNFIESIRAAATMGVQEFINVFINAAIPASIAALTMIALVAAAINTGMNQISLNMLSKGTEIIHSLAAGITIGSASVTAAIITVSKVITVTLNGMATTLNAKGKALMTNLATGIRGSSSLVINAMNIVLTQMMNRVNKTASELNIKGRTFDLNLSIGIMSGASFVVTAMRNVLTQMMNAINTIANQMVSRGKALINQFASGVKSGASYVTSAVNSILNSVSTAIRNRYNSFVNNGQYLMIGLANGISGNAWRASDAAWNAGRRVVERLNAATGVASPSKEAMKTGRFFDLGLMLGIVKYSSKAIGAAKDLGEEVVDELNPIADQFSFLDGFEPIITPTIDTSYVDKGISKLNSDFKSIGSVPIDLQGRHMSSAFRAMTAKQLSDAEIQNGSSGQVINNYDLTQNNYSPKALSRIEIYRDTKNQFSRLKEVVNA